jgi:hypothetical protein
MSSNFIGITTLHISGSLSVHHQEFLAVRRYGYNWYRRSLVALGHQPA